MLYSSTSAPHQHTSACSRDYPRSRVQLTIHELFSQVDDTQCCADNRAAVQLSLVP